ncbi:hypothetical protein T492DRAFT_907082, partial [Pavlovales sp. CCMP2436]
MAAQDIELNETKRSYVEVDLDSPGVSYLRATVEMTPWGPEARNDNVTPYTLRATNHTAKHLWLELLVDGTLIHRGGLHPGKSVDVEAINMNGTQRELLFCWPRFPVTDKGGVTHDPHTSTVGSISAKAYDCKLYLSGVTITRKQVDASSFKQADKDAARVAGNGSGAVSTTAAGNSLGKMTQKKLIGNRYDVEKSVEFATMLHYREGWALKEIGFELPSKKC